MRLNRTYIKTNEEARLAIAECAAAKLVGLDTETYTTDPVRFPDGALSPITGKIRLVQLATRESSFILDLYHVTDLEPLRTLLLDPEVRKIGQNLKFECGFFLTHMDCYVENAWDTYLASRMLEVFVKKIHVFGEAPRLPDGVAKDYRRHSLGVITKRYLGYEINKDEGASDWSVPELSAEQIEYAFTDAEVMLPLYDVLLERLTTTKQLMAARIEFAAIPAVAEMEVTGWGFDPSIIEDIRNVSAERRAALGNTLAKYFPSKQIGLFAEATINLDSPAQLKRAFEGRYGVELDSTDKTSLLAWRNPHDETLARQAVRLNKNDWKYTDERGRLDFESILKYERKTIEKIRSRLDNTEEVVDALVNYSSLATMVATADELLGSVHPVTGRIHSDLVQIGQEQHRMAVRKPNWAKIPRPDSFGPYSRWEPFKYERNFREAFIPRPGYKLSIFDYSGNQLRIVADQSNDPVMVRAFNEQIDLHQLTAAEILKKPIDQVLKSERQDAKGWNFAFSFMVGVRVFSNSVLKTQREYRPYKECEDMRNAWYETYKGVQQWHKACVRFVKWNHYCKTPIERRIHFHPESEIYTEAVNFPVSATEVDGAKLALARIFREIRKRGLDARIIGFVYDEIVIEVREDHADEVAELHGRLMQDSMQKMLKRVPALVEGGIASTWADK